jgi:hypothetical protein
MKEIYRKQIYIVLAKKVTTAFGTFLLGLGSDHQFYIDFISATGDYFVQTTLSLEILGDIWSNQHELVLSVETI